jgi:cellulose/xylan binding protein with CBM9 domain
MSVALLLFLAGVGPQAAIPPPPKEYVCRPAVGPMTIDGRLDEPSWANAPFTDDFVDIQGDAKPRPRFRTRVKMLWDDKYLYIGAELEEPHVRATLTEHDSVIFHDNDFEVFMDPNGDDQLYSELEMNALNATWDLLLLRPYRSGGPAVNGWDIKGLRTAVQVDGKLNDATSTSRGWTTEIAIPWSGIFDICRCPCPPRDGNQWRINFSRVEWPTRFAGDRYETIPGSHEDNWVWSPQGIVDMHRPDRWGVLQFTKQATGDVPAVPLDGWDERETLFHVWEAEGAYRRKNGRWSSSVADLELEVPGLQLFSTPDQFEAILGKYRINEQLRIWKQG